MEGRRRQASEQCCRVQEWGLVNWALSSSVGTVLPSAKVGPSEGGVSEGASLSSVSVGALLPSAGARSQEVAPSSTVGAVLLRVAAERICQAYGQSRQERLRYREQQRSRGRM